MHQTDGLTVWPSMYSDHCYRNLLIEPIRDIPNQTMFKYKWLFFIQIIVYVKIICNNNIWICPFNINAAKDNM